MLTRKIAVIALTACMAYGCMTKMNNHEMNDKELAEISSKAPATDYKKISALALNYQKIPLTKKN